MEMVTALRLTSSVTILTKIIGDRFLSLGSLKVNLKTLVLKTKSRTKHSKICDLRLPCIVIEVFTWRSTNTTLLHTIIWRAALIRYTIGKKN